MNIIGAIVKYSTWYSYGTKFYAKVLKELDKDPRVSGIVLNIDSGGGMVSGTAELTEIIKNLKTPTISYTSGYQCSAALDIASGCQYHMASPHADLIGSIGTMLSYQDFSAMFEKWGAKIYELYAPQSTEKNKEFRDLMQGDEKAYTERLKVLAQDFIERMKENFGEKLKDDGYVFKGKTYTPKEALQIGLLDELGPEEEGNFDDNIYEKTESKEGDLFEFVSKDKGIRHRFLCGSSTDSENWSKLLEKEKIDLLLTDPPYNVDYQGGTKEKLKIKNDKMNSDNFYRFLYDFFVNTYVFSNGGAPVYVFYADSEAINFRQAMLDAGYKISSTLVWVKNTFVLGRLDYHMQHEPVIFCEETQPTEIETHRPLIYGWNSEAAHPWHSDRKQSSVLRFDKPLRNADHPTMKPLDLISYLIKNSSKQKQIVADGFLGSGSTLIASEMNWRECRGFELDPRFADVIVRRWVAYMRENKLNYEVIRNGKSLTETEIEQFNKKSEE